MNEQREIIYGERRKVLSGEDMREIVMGMIKGVIDRAVEQYIGETAQTESWDMLGLNEYLSPIFELPVFVLSDSDGDMKKDGLKSRIYEAAETEYKKREEDFGAEQMREIERIIMLRVIDQRWMDHIDDMDQMRQGISLRAYAQRDPLLEYKFVSFDMFEELSNNIQRDTARGMFHVRIATQPEKREQVATPLATNKEDSNQRGPIKRKTAKIGRNDPCPCGSGKKYKQCCGANANAS